MKRSGIKEVAAAAGVSVATASYVLSGTGRTSEATRKRVLATADACLMTICASREIKERRRGRPSSSGDGGRIVKCEAAILANAGPS